MVAQVERIGKPDQNRGVFVLKASTILAAALPSGPPGDPHKAVGSLTTFDNFLLSKTTCPVRSGEDEDGRRDNEGPRHEVERRPRGGRSFCLL